MLAAVLLILEGPFAVFGRQTDAPAPYRVALPGKNWALDIGLNDFMLPAETRYQPRTDLASILFGLYTSFEEFNDDGSAYHLWVFQKVSKPPHKPLSLSIVLEPVQSASAAVFRASKLEELTGSARVVAGSPFGWGDGAHIRVSRGSIETWDYQNTPVVSYSTLIDRDEAVYNGGTMPRTSSGSKYIAAFYVKDGVGITVTLSGKSLKQDEEKFFYSLLDSARLVDVSRPVSSFDFYHKGRMLFLRKDYAAASEALGEALARERGGRRLDQTSWRDMVAKLADSYGMREDKARAKEVLEYGAAEEPANYFFQMGLARLYASLDDMDNTLASLEKAFSSMRREAPRAQLPDLKNDPAFKRFMQNERFSKAVKEMRK